MALYLIIVVFVLGLLAVTYGLGEWLVRRLALRFRERSRLMRGGAPAEPETDPAAG